MWVFVGKEKRFNIRLRSIAAVQRPPATLRRYGERPYIPHPCKTKKPRGNPEALSYSNLTGYFTITIFLVILVLGVLSL
jgi:hypothetical protein